VEAPARSLNVPGARSACRGEGGATEREWETAETHFQKAVSHCHLAIDSSRFSEKQLAEVILLGKASLCAS